MSAYALARLFNVTPGPSIVEYLKRIDATLQPFGGHFIIHGAKPEVVEGVWTGDLIVVTFPDMAAARAWYGSPDYRAILPLRLNNADGEGILIDGVDRNHRATDLLPPPLVLTSGPRLKVA